TMRMPVAAKLARQLYQERIIELKQLIKVQEENFRKVVTEIDEIRTGPSSGVIVPLPPVVSQQEVKQPSQQIIPALASESGSTQAITPSTLQQQHQHAFNVPIKQEASTSASVSGSSAEIHNVQLNQAIPETINQNVFSSDTVQRESQIDKIVDINSNKSSTNTLFIQQEQIKAEDISRKNIEKPDIIISEAVTSKNEVEINSSKAFSSARELASLTSEGDKIETLISRDTSNLPSESGIFDIPTTEISYQSIDGDIKSDETNHITMNAESSLIGVGANNAQDEINPQDFSFNREFLETIEEESPMQGGELVKQIENSVSTSPVVLDDSKLIEQTEPIISIEKQNDSRLLEPGNNKEGIDTTKYLFTQTSNTFSADSSLQLEGGLSKSEQLKKDIITNEVATMKTKEEISLERSYEGKATSQITPGVDFDSMDIDSSQPISVRRTSSHEIIKPQQKVNVDRELPKQGFVKRLIKESSYTPLAPSDFETPLTIDGDAEEVEKIDDNAMEVDQNEDIFIQGKVIENNSLENKQAFGGIDAPSRLYLFSSIDAPKTSFNEDGQVAEELQAMSNINVSTQPIELVDDILREQASVKEEPSDDDDVQMVDVYSDVEDSHRQESEKSVQDVQEKGISLIETFTELSKESPTESKEKVNLVEFGDVVAIPTATKHAESRKQDVSSVRIRETISSIETKEQTISGEPKKIDNLVEPSESIVINKEFEVKMEETEHDVVAESVGSINSLELKQASSSSESKEMAEIKENSEKPKEISSPKEAVSPTSSFKDPPSVNASTPSADAGVTPHSVSETPSADISESVSAEKRHKTWQRLVNMLLQEFANHRYAGLFQNPIREIDAPGYYNIVKQPMDLKTIKKHIREGIITDTDKFERDVMLMFMNALVFNRETTDVHKMTVSMRDQVEKLLKEFKQSENSRGGYEPTTRRKSMASVDGSRKRKGSKFQEG
ncbi:6640_t:CDS:2, partial [Ambispora leptoticha]